MNENQTSSISVTAGSPLMRPTKKQKELLSFIEQFIAEHGYSPSYREIMNGLAYTSVATVALHVGNLIKRGHVRKRDRSARSLEIVNPSLVTPTDLPTNQVKPNEEKWLVDKVEQRLSALEAAPLVPQHEIEDLAVLVAALRILGAEAAAGVFAPRVSVLRQRASEA